MITDSELLQKARLATKGQTNAVVAWLEGYAAGHSDATISAIGVLSDEGPFIAGETPEGLTDCVVCDGIGCEFCPVSDGSSGMSADA